MSNTAIANNILHFPNDRVKSSSHLPTPTSFEEVGDKVDDFKNFHIQEAIETIIPILFNQIHILGFEPSEDESDYVKDGALLVEAMRSFMCKLYNIHHPLQLVASSLFEEHEDEGFVISDRVKIVITPTESTD
jgi:hypothetical protein